MANPPISPQFNWKMFRYTPSLAAAIIGLIVFLIMALLHIWQYLKLRNRVIIFVIIGALTEVGGFGARIETHFNNASWGPFIAQGALLLVGPIFFAATIYMMLGRTIRFAGSEDVSLIPSRWYTRVFVTFDITTLFIQGFGASIMGTMQLKLALAGEKIVIAGLALQVATFVMFLIAAIEFQIRMTRKSARAPCSNALEPTRPWSKILYILYTYAMGNAGYPNSHEWMLYVFDAVPMFMVLLLLLVLQPARYLSEGDLQHKDPKDNEMGAVQTQVQ